MIKVRKVEIRETCENPEPIGTCQDLALINVAPGACVKSEIPPMQVLSCEPEDSAFSGTSSFSDSFERGHLQSAWQIYREPACTRAFGTIEIVDVAQEDHELNICRPSHAVRFNLPETPKKNHGRVEREEIGTGKEPLLEQDAWYAFSLYLPPSFPTSARRLVLTQWKQSGYPNASPLVSLRLDNGQFRAEVRLAEHSENPTKAYRGIIEGLTLGEWHVFSAHLKFSPYDGIFELWMDGEKRVTYEGRLGNPDSENLFYHKIGLYRNGLERSMSLYVSDFRKGPTCEQVAPNPSKICKR